MTSVMDWYQSLRNRKSTGSQTNNINGLAGIAEARRQHNGQFFTPSALARWIWNLVADPISITAEFQRRKVTIVDSSIGSGRLIQFADPEITHLCGCDIDRSLIRDLGHALQFGGFSHDIEAVAMENLRGSGRADLAIINPPFSIHIDTPTVEAFPSGTWGKHHRHSSTLSHLHAVHQACAWAACVITILPASAVAALQETPPSLPLRAIYYLPSSTFREEGAEVKTVVLIFRQTETNAPVQEHVVDDLDVLPPPLPISNLGGDGDFMLVHPSQQEKAVITEAFTGDTTVRVSRHLREIRLHFACGLTHAKVINGLMSKRIMYDREDPVRRHPSIAYHGEGWRDIENFIGQSDPMQAWDEFLDRIRGAGGSPVVDRCLTDHLRKRARRHRLAIAPFGQWIYDPTASCDDCFAVELQKPLRTGPRFGSPVLKPGTKVFVHRWVNGFTVTHQKQVIEIDEETLLSITGRTLGKPEWKQARVSAVAYYPQQASAIECKARALGLDRHLSREYQWEDLIELVAKGCGSGAAWDMSLGKARLALALALLGGRRNVIVLQAHLVDEMRREIATTGMVADGDWKVIETPDDLLDLRRVNIITYSRLRMPLYRLPGQSVDDQQEDDQNEQPDAGDDNVEKPKTIRVPTYADRLRRARMHTVVCDEAQVLCNPASQQTRAVHRIGGRKRFALTGTPVANYVRDLLPLLVWVGGDATARQPFGYRYPYHDPRNLTDTKDNRRAIDKFRETFVTTKWVTNEFCEDMTSGAKREIPQLRNASEFQRLIAPLFKRRRVEEPMVTKYFSIPKPDRETTVLDWDAGHLAHYLSVCENFMAWYASVRESKRGLNLVAILARIAAVENAANCPDHPGKHAPAYVDETSKHRAAIERLQTFTDAGHRTILFANRPATVERLAVSCRERGIRCMTFHGQQTIGKRNRALYRDFVDGDIPVLIATIGSCQTGLNLHAANRVIFYERSWTAKAENQAAARVLRPQQKRKVAIEHLELMGSIDRYKGQLVGAKDSASRLAIDYEIPDDTEEFLHLDTILARFVQDVETILGVDRNNLRETLRTIQTTNGVLACA